MFLQRLDAPRASGIAKVKLDGFNRHDPLYCTEWVHAKHRLEMTDWQGQKGAQCECMLRLRHAVSTVSPAVRTSRNRMDTTGHP